MRSDLTRTELAEHLAKREELCELRGKSSPTFQAAAPGQTGFADETEKAMGVSKRTINQAVARANKMSNPVRANH